MLNSPSATIQETGALPDLPFGDMVPLHLRVGTHYERTQVAWVNRQMVLYVTSERIHDASVKQPEYTAVYLAGTERPLKIAEPLEFAVAALQVMG